MLGFKKVPIKRSILVMSLALNNKGNCTVKCERH